MERRMALAIESHQDLNKRQWRSHWRSRRCMQPGHIHERIHVGLAEVSADGPWTADPPRGQARVPRPGCRAVDQSTHSGCGIMTAKA